MNETGVKKHRQEKCTTPPERQHEQKRLQKRYFTVIRGRGTKRIFLYFLSANGLRKRLYVTCLYSQIILYKNRHLEASEDKWVNSYYI